MNESIFGQIGGPQRYDDLKILLRSREFEAVRLIPAGKELILEGQVASYEIKRQLEGLARNMGLRTRNHLRVVPFLIAPEPNMQESGLQPH